VFRMKLLLICPGVEPGLDAVGDYTRELAKSLQEEGHNPLIVAWSDKAIAQPVSRHDQRMTILRLPGKGWSDKAKLRWLQANLGNRDWDWVSLQWVGFGYHSKGIPFSFAHCIKCLAGSTPVHIMFHEIWIHTDPSTPFKARILGFGQRLMHQRLIQNLNPTLIHTHAEPYRQALKTIGASSVLSLPLPSNIRPRQGVSESGLTLPAIWYDSESLRMVIFGHVPSEWDIRPLLAGLAEYARNHGKKPILLFCGRGGVDMSRLEQWRNQLQALGGNCLSLGFVSEMDLAAILEKACLGVATVPFALWQKSSAVATYRAWGLPVVFSRFDGSWPDSWLPVWESDFLRADTDLAKAIVHASRGLKTDAWPTVSRKMSHDLRVVSRETR
jgi:hypothetical protein